MSARLCCLLLVIVGAGAYANSLNGPFVFDDEAGIERNASIRSLAGALRPPDQGQPTAGRPAVNLSLALNYAVHGSDVRGYHLVNIAIHVLAALVLFDLVRLTLSRRPFDRAFGAAANSLAFATALLWVAHPMQTECVNYLSQRTESMMGLFFLLTLNAAIRAHGATRSGWAMVSVLCCGLGMASKEVMVTAPVMVILYDWAFRTEPFGRVLRRRHRFYLALASTWIVLWLLNWGSPRSDTAGFASGVTPMQWASVQCRIVLDYLRLAVWPHPLNLDYGPFQAVPFGELAPWVVAMGLILLATAVLLLVRPRIGFGLAWCFIILAPTSSIVPIVSEVAAERRMYVPLAGLVALVVVGGYAIIGRLSRRWSATGLGRDRWIIAGYITAVCLVAAPLLVLTVRRNTQYASEVALWQSAIEAMPDNSRAHVNLANTVRDDLGDLGRAERHYRTALRLRPTNAIARTNLGAVLASQGRLDEAIDEFRLAIETDRHLSAAHRYLATAQAQRARREVADRPATAP